MFKVSFSGKDIAALEAKLAEKSVLALQEVERKQIADIYTRSQDPGGTPVGDYTGGGQLRHSAAFRVDEFGYIKEYGPHVEYGHRTRSGGFVPGQYYLRKNVDLQREIYKKDLIQKLKE